VTVQGADIDRSACTATGTINIKPRRSGGQCASDRWRPQHRPLGIPPFDHAKVEYNHFDFGSDSGTFITGNSVTLDTVKAGVNYRFGGPSGPWWPF
jgi:hypothetical protein